MEAKSYFVRNNIAYREVNVERDARGREEMRLKTGGYPGIPVIDINGTILRGFSSKAIERALKKN
ncbi:MAG: glutaredoxin domain-containing protein [bacterium]|nr:glutaredoxin domain-containing protein [bacterium]